MVKVNLGAKHYLFPQPAVIAGINVEGKPNYMTVAWCGIMQGDPAIIYVSVRKVRYSLTGIKENRSFSVNVPSTQQVAVTDFIGTKSGARIDKSVVFKSFYGELKTAPMIEECPINMECRLIDILDYKGTHEICVGEIVQTFADESCLTDGIPDMIKVDPIVFSTGFGRYFKTGDVIAKAFDVYREYEYPENGNHS